jgi:hypothetical protein
VQTERCTVWKLYQFEINVFLFYLKWHHIQRKKRKKILAPDVRVLSGTREEKETCRAHHRPERKQVGIIISWKGKFVAVGELFARFNYSERSPISQTGQCIELLSRQFILSHTSTNHAWNIWIRVEKKMVDALALKGF